jgi:hypothetical protein
MQDDFPVTGVEHFAMLQKLGAVVSDIGAVERPALAIGPGRHEIVVLGEIHDPVAHALEMVVEDRPADSGVLGLQTARDRRQPTFGRRAVFLEHRDDRSARGFDADAAHLGHRGAVIARRRDHLHLGELARDALARRGAHAVDDDRLGAELARLLAQTRQASEQELTAGSGSDDDRNRGTGHALVRSRTR